LIKLKQNEDITEDIQFKNPLIIIGFPGIAMVGKFAVLTLIKYFNAKPLFWLFYQDMPAQAMVAESAKMRLPKTTFYVIPSEEKEKASLDRDLIFITGDEQPTSSAGIYYFADFICKKCKEFNAKEVIATGAFVPEQIQQENRLVYVSGTSKDKIDFFLKSETKLTKLMNGGYIAGANGIIPAWASIHYQMDGSCLLAEAYPMLQRDPRASKSILMVLNERYKINVDLTLFDKEIKEIESVSQEFKDYMGQKTKDKLRTQQNYYG